MKLSEGEIGGICGIVQTLVGHPMDTIKVWIQNKKNIDLQINKLYRGIYPPLLTHFGIGYFLFGSTDYFNKYFDNYFISGFISGLGIAPLMNSSEYLKINQQMNMKKITSNILLKGLNITLIREGIGSSSYFGSYFYLKDYLNPFIAGGIGGMLSWVCTYPLDVIKTRVQCYPHDHTYLSALKMGNLWNGIGITMLRGFIVNGSVFYVYDFLKK